MDTPSDLNSSGLCIGIDLGTTYSCVAVYQRGTATVVPNQGVRTTPSHVAFTDSDVLVGENAVENRKFDLKRTFYDCKRLIGRRGDDPVLLQDMKMWGYSVESVNNKPKFQVQYRGGSHQLSPTHVGAVILHSLKVAAEAAMHQPVSEAVITVPAYFSNSQRSSTRMAGELAGLNVTQIVNEPTAAAVAYCFDNGLREKSLILVFDIGGGTFDVSLLDVDYNPLKSTLYPIVQGSSGHGHLGGLDFTEMMRNLLVKKFVELQPEYDLVQDAEAMDILMAEAEKAKRMLSNQQSVRGKVRNLFKGVDLEYTVTAAEFESVIYPLLEQTLIITTELLTSCKKNPEEVKNVVLVGGSTRIPAVRRMLQTLFLNDAIISINADEDVARGAAFLAGSHRRDPAYPYVFLRDVTPIPLGVIAVDQYGREYFDVVLDKHTLLPHHKVVRDEYNRSPHQNTVEVTVQEGFSRNVKMNTLIGNFELTNLHDFPDTSPVDVEFNLDLDGLLTVNVKDVRTGVGLEKEMQVGDVEFTQAELVQEKQLLHSMLAPGQL